MSALPPKADIRFTLRHVCFVPLTRRRFIAFLKGLENEGPHTELLIVGDTFGLWELTLVEGIEKLDHIITAHQAIFDQLRATGARIKVTMMVGNHDYDLACNPDFAAQLKVYNIRLDKSLVQQDANQRVGIKIVGNGHGRPCVE
jgi:UDP-2,3-diacylglucosamine pyrophosphatase LpxH